MQIEGCSFIFYDDVANSLNKIFLKKKKGTTKSKFGF